MTTLDVCSVCSRDLGPRSGFVLAGRRHCITCTLFRSLLLVRSFLTALVVGSIITAINQGDHIVSHGIYGNLWWKIPLTYCVPFCVATWGALINSRPIVTKPGE